MAIAFVAAADLGNNGGSGTLTASYTVGSGANRRLYVNAIGDTTSDLISGATYAGTTMRLVGKHTAASGGRWVYLFALDNPTSGANNVVITESGSSFILAQAADYSGVKQTGADDNETSNTGASPLTTALITVADNCWTILGEADAFSGSPPTAGTGSTRRAVEGTFGVGGLFDSNGVVHPAGSYSMTYSAGGGATTLTCCVMASFEPDTGGGGFTALNRKTLTGIGSHVGGRRPHGWG